MQTTKLDISEELEELLDFAHPTAAREILWDWLKLTIAGNFATEIGPNEKTLIINLYEKLDNFLRAVEMNKCTITQIN
ncbi:hypothetical protein [Sediminibacterium goheungense]|uniref:Uncharacterized protein n=1 Tax=Sediminibacterium goheungense TaxID=1086393 RepID=A0A4R6IW56_9BACT|nr:hypothetical protein [Sediminibacterium goheungense]TDO26561.1 hypothetical protein BC659_1868 [Sediminibacterium goheungense]